MSNEAATNPSPSVLSSTPSPGVALLTLNRPERMNAWTQDMSDLLCEHLERLDADDTVRVVVITGAGRAFCAGVDIGQFTSRDRSGPRSRRPWQDRLIPSELTKPVVAAINGAAVGIGLSYAAHCDVRFVASDAKLGFVFNRRGMVPELGIHEVVTRLVGHGLASELMISGRIFDGREAADIGLASAALPTDDVLPAALEWAADVAANCNPASVGATKWLMWRSRHATDRRSIAVEDDLAVEFARAGDSQEGMVAFRERRPPQWTSRHRDGYDLADQAATAAHE